MEEYQEAEILWPESIQNPQSFVNWPIYLNFTPSESEASLSSTSSSNSTCTQNELHESELSWPGTGDDSYFLSIRSLSKEIHSEVEWQEADVLWPEPESLRHHDFEFEWEDCSVGGEHELMKLGEATKSSSPINIPKRKINKFEHFL